MPGGDLAGANVGFRTEICRSSASHLTTPLHIGGDSHRLPVGPGCSLAKRPARLLGPVILVPPTFSNSLLSGISATTRPPLTFSNSLLSGILATTRPPPTFSNSLLSGIVPLVVM